MFLIVGRIKTTGKYAITLIVSHFSYVSKFPDKWNQIVHKILNLYLSSNFSFRCFVLTCNKSFYKLLFSYFTVNTLSLIRQEESTMSIPEFTTQLETCHLVWDFKNCTWIPFCCGLVILVSVYKIRYTSKHIQWNFYKKKKIFAIVHVWSTIYVCVHEFK